MLKLAEFYRVRRGGGIGAWLGRRRTPILAYKIMPAEGYDWLARNPRMLDVWLSLLTDDSSGAGSFKMALNRAFEKTMQLLRSSKLKPVSIQTREPEGTEAGEAFLEWMRKGLQNGDLQINQKNGSIYMTKDGLFLDIATLSKEFSKSSHVFSADQVYDQFKDLGLAAMDGDDFESVQLIDETPVTTETKSSYDQARGKSAIFRGLAQKQGTQVSSPDVQKTSFKDSVQRQANVTSDVVRAGITKTTRSVVSAIAQKAIGTQRHSAVYVVGQTARELKNGVIMPQGMHTLLVSTNTEIANLAKVVRSVANDVANSLTSQR